MTGENPIHTIHFQARNLLNSELAGPVTINCRIETPMAVHAPDMKIHSWFVPVTAENRIIGFFQFLEDGTYMRFSSFQRKPDKLTGCPEAADWLDPDRIQQHAEVQRRLDETSGTPFITYDRTPDRLVWAVPLTGPEGKVRLIYVAGKIAYTPPPNGTYY